MRAVAVCAMVVGFVLSGTAPAAAQGHAQQRPFHDSIVARLEPGPVPSFVGTGVGTMLGRFRFGSDGTVSTYTAANGDVMVTINAGEPTTWFDGAPCSEGETGLRWRDTVVSTAGRDGPASTGRFAKAHGELSVTACAVLDPDGVARGAIRIWQRGTLTFTR